MYEEESSQGANSESDDAIEDDLRQEYWEEDPDGEWAGDKAKTKNFHAQARERRERERIRKERLRWEFP